MKKQERNLKARVIFKVLNTCTPTILSLPQRSNILSRLLQILHFFTTQTHTYTNTQIYTYIYLYLSAHPTHATPRLLWQTPSLHSAERPVFSCHVGVQRGPGIRHSLRQCSCNRNIVGSSHNGKIVPPKQQGKMEEILGYEKGSFQHRRSMHTKTKDVPSKWCRCGKGRACCCPK